MDQSRADLARRQADLVAALVGGVAIPDGFDEARVRATEEALLRKRAGEVGARWPTLRAQFGADWTSAFSEWARGRAPGGSWRDGWDFARHLSGRGELHPAAAVDLAVAGVTYAYDGVHPPRRRRGPRYGATRAASSSRSPGACSRCRSGDGQGPVTTGGESTTANWVR